MFLKSCLGRQMEYETKALRQLHKLKNKRTTKVFDDTENNDLKNARKHKEPNYYENNEEKNLKN